MNTTVADYLLGPRGVWARIAVSAWCLVVSVVIFFVSPAGLGVSAAWLAVVLAWCGVVAASHRRARARAAASISAPNAEQLAADARTARRHAAQFDLPAAPWRQLEAFWSVAGDIPIVIEPIAALTATGPDPFMDELRDAMLTAVDDDHPDVIVGGSELHSEDEPFDLDAFIARTSERYTRDRRNLGEPAARQWMTHEIDTHLEQINAAVARRDAPRPVENLCRDCGQRVGWISRSQRCKPCTELSKRAWSMPAGSLADLATRTGRTVEIVNGAGEVVATHPSSDADQVRCTWPLSGELTEDAEVVAALRAHGVKVATEMYGGQLVAHLSGTHGDLKAARATYMRGLRERTATGKATG